MGTQEGGPLWGSFAGTSEMLGSLRTSYSYVLNLMCSFIHFIWGWGELHNYTIYIYRSIMTTRTRHMRSLKNKTRNV